MKKINQPKKRVSNRRYPPRICRKPECHLEYIPIDSRQIYCCEQHRIDFNNDKRKEIEEINLLFLRKVKKNKMLLEKIESSNFYKKDKGIHISVLKYEGYDFEFYHKKVINDTTHKEVYVCHNYYLELFDAEKEMYLIIKL